MESFSQRLALTLGSAAAIGVSAGAHAALVTVTDAPVSVGFDRTQQVGNNWQDQAIWDVDGVNGGDFALRAAGGVNGSGNNYTIGGGIALGVYSFTAPGYPPTLQRLNGEGVKNSLIQVWPYGTASYGVAPLLSSSYVNQSGMEKHGRILRGRFSVSQYPNYYSTYSILTWRTISADFKNFGGPGTFNIGFQFNSGGSLHYGWAIMRIGGLMSVSIDEWTYETTPDTAVHVGTRASEIPAPPAALSALTLLGLGAAGVRRMRKQKEAAAA